MNLFNPFIFSLHQQHSICFPRYLPISFVVRGMMETAPLCVTLWTNRPRACLDWATDPSIIFSFHGPGHSTFAAGTGKGHHQSEDGWEMAALTLNLREDLVASTKEYHAYEKIVMICEVGYTLCDCTFYLLLL